MGKLLSKAILVQDFEIVLDNQRGHSTVADQPLGGSPGFGPTPLELCVMSHAGCYATICALVAKKLRLQLHGLEVKVEAVKAEDTGTIAEDTFSILLKTDAPEDKIRKLHELTLKNCPVGKIFEAAGVRLNYSLARM